MMLNQPATPRNGGRGVAHARFAGHKSARFPRSGS